jgi:multisubunit Na+/H+ antiporter MnhG subunit
MTPRAIVSASHENLLQRAKAFFGAALFLGIHRFPRLLQLHRNAQSWTLFRIALACLGAAIVVLPLSLWNGWITASFGLLLFVVAILLPPAQLESATDRKARELGAQTVVGGGEYQPENAPAEEVRLFISPTLIWALDSRFDPLLVMPAADISSLRVEEKDQRWLLQIQWADRKAEFAFTGFFAERFARLAEESIRAALPQELSAAPKRRAFSAG